jgi:hypothetical protein
MNCIPKKSSLIKRLVLVVVVSRVKSSQSRKSYLALACYSTGLFVNFNSFSFNFKYKYKFSCICCFLPLFLFSYEICEYVTVLEYGTSTRVLY